MTFLFLSLVLIIKQLSLAVMFRGTPCICLSIFSLSIQQFFLQILLKMSSYMLILFG